MSDASHREWGFYIDDMIDFAEKVLAYPRSSHKDSLPDAGP